MPSLIILGCTMGVIFLGLVIARFFLKGNNCYHNRDISKETIVVTGANTGIGYETARELCRKKATVILGCRDLQKGQKALDNIKKDFPQSKAHLILLDLSDLTSITPFVNEVKKITKHITILINNAGVCGLLKRQETKQGLELTVGTNHFGHAYLTDQLLHLFDKQHENRIINVSSSVYHKKSLVLEQFNSDSDYNPFKSYQKSKLANILNALFIHETFKETHNLKAVSLHPGIVATEVVRNFRKNWYFRTALDIGGKYLYQFITKNPLEGAQTTLHCCLEDFSKLEGSAFYQDCKVTKLRKELVNLDDAKKFQHYTSETLKRKLNVK